MIMRTSICEGLARIQGTSELIMKTAAIFVHLGVSCTALSCLYTLVFVSSQLLSEVLTTCLPMHQETGGSKKSRAGHKLGRKLAAGGGFEACARVHCLCDLGSL